jgi:hypothetical protein
MKKVGAIIFLSAGIMLAGCGKEEQAVKQPEQATNIVADQEKSQETEKPAEKPKTTPETKPEEKVVPKPPVEKKKPPVQTQTLKKMDEAMALAIVTEVAQKEIDPYIFMITDQNDQVFIFTPVDSKNHPVGDMIYGVKKDYSAIQVFNGMDGKLVETKKVPENVKESVQKQSAPKTQTLKKMDEAIALDIVTNLAQKDIDPNIFIITDQNDQVFIFTPVDQKNHPVGDMIYGVKKDYSAVEIYNGLDGTLSETIKVPESLKQSVQ